MISRTVLAFGLALLSTVAVAPKLAAADLPSPTLLVVLKGENALAIIDPVAKKVLGKVPVADGPHEVAVSTDGKYAFVSSYGGPDRNVHPGRTISMIDLAAQKEMRRVEVGMSPHGEVFRDGKLYFTAQGYKMIGRYDPAADKIDWILGTGQNRTHRLVFTKDGTKIFTANSGSNTVSMFDRSGEPPDYWNQTLIHVGKGPEALDMSPDEKEVWTGHNADCCVSIIDVASKKVAQTLDIQAKRINGLKFTLDGKRVLITDMATNILTVVDAAQRKTIMTMPLGHSPESIVMAPDGVHAHISVSNDNSVAVLDLNTMKVLEMMPVGKDPDGLAWLERK